MLKSNKKNKVWSVVLLAPTFALSGCGSSSSLSKSVTISAVLSGKGSALAMSKFNRGSNARISGSFGSRAASVSGVDAVCYTDTDSGTGTVGSDGKLSVTIDNASGKKIACSFLSADGDALGDMLFSDSSKRTLNGSASVDNAIALSSNADAGSITLDTDSGEAIVDASKLGSVVASTSVSAGSAFDFTGAWTIGEYPTAELTAADKAAKFKNTLCEGHGGDCNGPPKGQSIFLKRATGKDSSGNDAFGMMVWQGQSAFAACGSVIGGTYASIKSGSGIDFTDSGIAEGAYTFSTTVNVNINGSPGSATLTDGWKLSTATAQWAMQNCGPVAVGDEKGWKCTDGAGKTQTSLGGGCKLNSTSKAVQPNSGEWSSISSCSQSGPNADGFYTMTCTGSISAGAVTCTNKYKQDSGFDWSTVATVVAQGASCSSIGESTNQLKLAKLQCYANAYYSQNPSGGCMKKIQTDWTTTDPDLFIDNSNSNPDSLVFANIFKYNPDGISGGMFDRKINYRGVHITSNGQDSWVNCKVKEVGALTIAKVSDTKLKATYISTTSLMEEAGVKPACDVQFANGTVDKFLFYLTK